jgi:hypothetical protein
MKVIRSTLRIGCLYPLVNIPGSHFCYRLGRTQSHSAAIRTMSMKNFNDTIGNRTRYLLTLVQSLNQLRHQQLTTSGCRNRCNLVKTFFFCNENGWFITVLTNAASGTLAGTMYLLRYSRNIHLNIVYHLSLVTVRCINLLINKLI